ncbi:MAG: MgtC/SapB family protein [Candidatus Omnitrophica bacterium]|nr:MgtC/SapB family protein [Candidatus Omnitrophota bacterium]
MLTFTAYDVDVAVRLIVATLLGGLVGLEREWQGKQAGFRTHALVCLGSALAMIVSVEIYEIYKNVTVVDPSRIASQVITGIGFLGAGTIIRFSQGVRGLTTAAGIWATAGIGLACGLAEYKPAIIAAVLMLIILIVFSKIDQAVGRK